MSAVEQLIGKLGEVCAGLPDQRKGPARDGDYTMADIGLSAFSIFFMQSPSFLGHQRALAEGHGKSNCQTLFGMQSIPSDKYIRLMLDGAAPAALDGALYYNSFVTDLAITSANVAELAACGRARWKIESGTFNVLKNNGYNLERNFGHGKKTLSNVLVTLNLLAFAFHTAAYLGIIAWRAAVIARGPTYRFFEHLRTITTYIVLKDWAQLLQSIAEVAIRPP